MAAAASVRASAAAATARAVTVSATSSNWRGSRASRGIGGVEFLRSCCSPSASRTTDACRVIARCNFAAGQCDPRLDVTELGVCRSGIDGVRGCGLPGAAADHEALQQAVGRQPVRAVHAGARHLARGEQPGKFGAAVHVGDDAAAAVVRARHHRNRLPRRIDPGGPAGRRHRREPAREVGRSRGRRGTRTDRRSRAAGRRWRPRPHHAGPGHPSDARPRSSNHLAGRAESHPRRATPR